jgi:hypothetical protein
MRKRHLVTASNGDIGHWKESGPALKKNPVFL